MIPCYTITQHRDRDQAIQDESDAGLEAARSGRAIEFQPREMNMAGINISEADFTAVANAAMDAKERGDNTEAAALDKIARKINASLGNASMDGAPFRRGTKRLTWRDVPSVLGA